jgi:hypothetical protein
MGSLLLNCGQNVVRRLYSYQPYASANKIYVSSATEACFFPDGTIDAGQIAEKERRSLPLFPSTRSISAATRALKWQLDALSRNR